MAVRIAEEKMASFDKILQPPLDLLAELARCGRAENCLRVSRVGAGSARRLPPRVTNKQPQ